MKGNCGVTKIIWGALLLLNAYVWPQWSGIDGWVAWVAVLMVVTGIVMLLWKPKECKMPAAKKPAKKRKR